MAGKLADCMHLKGKRAKEKVIHQTGVNSLLSARLVTGRTEHEGPPLPGPSTPLIKEPSFGREDIAGRCETVN